MKDNFSLLIKPASADCNLCCDYCFYLDKKSLYPDETIHRMSEDTLKQVFKSYLSEKRDVYSITWQGGEPTLMGTEFYRRAVDLQKHFASPGSRMMNSIQTNAFSIPGDLAELMAKYRFVAGCSLDGPDRFHDVYRKTCSKASTHSQVLNGINKLDSAGVPVNVLCMVTSANADYPEEVYNYFKDLGFTFIQFIPCVEHDDNNKFLPFSITPEQWGSFLTSVFEQWYLKDTKRISVRNFESVLAKLVMNSAAECKMSEKCNQYLVVEYNGDIYPCDFFVESKYKLGNIHETSFEDLRRSDSYKDFMEMKSLRNIKCSNCSFLNLCMGDCPKFRTNISDLSYLCSGWEYFFSKTTERFQKLAESIS